MEQPRGESLVQAGKKAQCRQGRNPVQAGAVGKRRSAQLRHEGVLTAGQL